MRIYPKIDTLFVRDAAFKLTDELRHPVLGDIKKWIVTEKVDGTNIRISKRNDEDLVEFNGRSDNAHMPGDLAKLIIETFTPSKMAGLFVAEAMPGTRFTLFGEGYGGSIQKGSRLSLTKKFILFDVLIEVPVTEGVYQGFWQSDNRVTAIADFLGIRRVPIIGEWDLSQIVDHVSLGIPSRVAETPGTMAEGIVARTREPLFDARGNRLILKLKTSDFK